MARNEDEDIIDGAGNSAGGGALRPLFNTKDVPFLKFTKAGTVELDIIPFRNSAGKLVGGYFYNLHKGLGPKKGNRVICRARDFGEACPVCEAQADVLGGEEYKTVSKEKQKLFKSFYPQERVIYNVIYEGKHYLFDQSQFKFSEPLAQKAKAFQEKKKLESFNYLSPKNGWKVEFDVVETENELKPGSTYFAPANFNFVERDEQYDSSIVDKMVALDKVAVKESYEVVEKILYGGSVEETISNEVEEDEAPAEAPAKAPEPETKKADAPKEEKKASGPNCPKGMRFGKDFKNEEIIDYCENDCDLFIECRKKNRQLAEDTL